MVRMIYTRDRWCNSELKATRERGRERGIGLMRHAVTWKRKREKLTTNLPISPSIIQLNATKATVFGERRDAIANALGALVAVLAVAVVRDAIFHQNVLVKHLKAIFHFGILEEVGADEIRLLLDGRLTAKGRDWLRARNALLFVLVQVGCPP